MPFAPANGVNLCYESFGVPGDPAVLLLPVYSAQMLVWPQPWCEGLAARGYQVIRLDLRDTGLSSKMDEAGLPDLMGIVNAPPQEREAMVPYTLADLAEDAFGLLDAVGVEATHLVGASLGGMIAQVMAIAKPGRVLSLTSIMSTPDVAQSPSVPEAMNAGGPREGGSKDARVEAFMASWRAIGTEAFGPSDEELQAFAEASIARSHYPQGPARQIAAIQAAPGRESALSRLDLPCLVIHGTEDPFIPMVGGELTAMAVRGAELVGIEGMGHELFSPSLVVVEKVLTEFLEKQA